MSTEYGGIKGICAKVKDDEKNTASILNCPVLLNIPYEKKRQVLVLL